MSNHTTHNRTLKEFSSSTFSEAQFDSVVDSIPIMMRVSGPDNRYIYFNQSWLSFTGRSLEQESGDGWIEGIHPDDCDHCLAQYRSSFESRENLTLTYRLRRHDRQYRWILDTLSPRYNPQGAFIGYIATSIDVTEQKESEQRLRQSEEKYRSLFETMAQGVIYWDAQGNLLQANPAALKALGYTLEDMQNWKSISPEWRILNEDGQPLDRTKQPTWVALQTGLPVTNVVMGVYNPTDQQFHWLRTSAVPQFHPGDDKPYGVFSTFEDITERRQADNSLRFLFNATSLLNATLDYEITLKNIAQLAVPQLADWCAIDMLESDGSLRRLAVQHVDPQKIDLAHEIWRRWPPDMSATTGVPQLLRTGQYELIAEITDDMIEAIADPVLRQIMQSLGLRSSIAVPILAKGKALGAITLVSAESGRRYSVEDAKLAQEIAHHAGLAIENARLFTNTQQINQQLEQRVGERTSALEVTIKELESFSYSVSHDLRAPLRTIDGFSRAILEDYGDKLDEEGKNYLDRVRLATQHMGQLIDDLLKLSRVTRGEMYRQTIDLSAMANASINSLQSLDPSRKAKISIAPNLMVNGDVHLLRIVVDNLLSNAWKFTTNCENPLIEVGSMIDQGKTTYFVRDNGAGFDMTYINKLFNPFQRLHTESEFKGTGIGLATVQRIIHRHGGHIWATGEVGKGATFYFTL